MGFGSCTVLIFSCPASALGLGGPPFLTQRRPNPNPKNNLEREAGVLIDSTEPWQPEHGSKAQ